MTVQFHCLRIIFLNIKFNYVNNILINIEVKFNLIKN